MRDTEDVVSELSKAFALSVPHDSALEIRDEVGFFQEVRSVLAKPVDGGDGKKSSEELETAVRQIVSRAITSDKVIDSFDAAGLKKPDMSILSDEFLAEVQHLPQRNLTVELLQKLLNNELKIRSKKYLVQSRSFGEMLEGTLRKYQNRTIESAQVIAELIELVLLWAARPELGSGVDSIGMRSGLRLACRPTSTLFLLKVPARLPKTSQNNLKK